jgi:ABC-type bacteriocin/lantibiotic exporter with double-glycine peptidase domain
LRYREGLPAVLKNLTLDIRGGERIGIGMAI